MRYSLAGIVMVGWAAGCVGPDDSQPSIAADTAPAATAVAPPPQPAPDSTASAVVRDSAGQELGMLTLKDDSAGITVTGTLRGLPPGEHALHLHGVGQCEPPFQSAGGHWNPTNRQHGSQNPQGPHSGDLPNITVAADSTVAVRATTPGGDLRGANGLLDTDGAAVVIHQKGDDYKTDPAGAAGSRIACGVVQAPM